MSGSRHTRGKGSVLVKKIEGGLHWGEGVALGWYSVSLYIPSLKLFYALHHLLLVSLIPPNFGFANKEQQPLAWILEGKENFPWLTGQWRVYRPSSTGTRLRSFYISTRLPSIRLCQYTIKEAPFKNFFFAVIPPGKCVGPFFSRSSKEVTDGAVKDENRETVNDGKSDFFLNYFLVKIGFWWKQQPIWSVRLSWQRGRNNNNKYAGRDIIVNDDGVRIKKQIRSSVSKGNAPMCSS